MAGLVPVFVKWPAHSSAELSQAESWALQPTRSYNRTEGGFVLGLAASLCCRRVTNLSFRKTGVTKMALRSGQRLIAIVDDDKDVREAIRELMRAMGLPAEAFSSAEEFLHSGHVSRTACLIADVNMPGMSGLDLYYRLTELGNVIPTILITAYPTDAVRSPALAAGVIKYLTKPFAEADLVDGVRIALAKGPT